MAIADRRKREREQRRNEIIDAAEKLFFAKGYDNVTMDEIANAAEVNKALLYYYFKNKEALFFAVDLRGVRILHKMHVEYSKLNNNALNKLRTMNKGFFDFTKKYPGYARMFQYAGSVRFEMSDNVEAKEVLNLSIEMFRLMVEIILGGMKEGLIRNDLDPVEIAVYLHVTSWGVWAMDPGLKELLRTRGITEDQIFVDFRSFMRPALTNRPYSDLEANEDNSNDQK